ncbi:MAG: hypothetical protein QY320_06465 [Gammaproteobacteria bacterium]|nr:MAG: hypothetical protein QY320_06465 [Gammaproteobacteria bacterium]
MTRGGVTEYKHYIPAGAGNLMVNLSFSAFGSRRGSAWQDVPSNDDWNQITATTRRGFTAPLV